MTEHHEILLRFLLQILFEADGPLAETILHAGLQNRAGISVTMGDFDLVLKHSERERWINGVKGALGRTRWMITPKGQLALAEIES